MNNLRKVVIYLGKSGIKGKHAEAVNSDILHGFLWWQFVIPSVCFMKIWRKELEGPKHKEMIRETRLERWFSC